LLIECVALSEESLLTEAGAIIGQLVLKMVMRPLGNMYVASPLHSGDQTI